MKKSEMITLMMEDIAYIQDQSDVETLLDKMINAGMLPPVNPNNYHEDNKQDRIAVCNALYYYEWEQERKVL